MSEGIFSTREEREQLREGLTALGFDGPRPIGGGFFLATEVAVCLTCGAMILLGDPIEAPHNPGQYVERGILLHYQHHHPGDLIFTSNETPDSDQEQRP